MIIYGEYLFLENFIVALALLVLTGKLTGKKSSKGRLFLGATIGAFGSFIIFLPMTVYLSVLLRIITGLFSVLASFGRTLVIRITAIYFILTFASGGMVMALSLWIQKPTITHQGIIYMEALTYLKLISFGILAFGLIYWFVKLIRTKGVARGIFGEAKIYIEEKVYSFKGFVDSGNYLKNPLDSKPVILIDRNGSNKLPFEPSQLPHRFALVPYKTVGVDCGFLECIRTDRVEFGEHLVEGACLAFYDGEFEGYQVLLNRSFLEGGLLNETLSKSK